MAGCLAIKTTTPTIPLYIRVESHFDWQSSRVADITYQAEKKAAFQGCSTVRLPLSAFLSSPTFPLNRYLVSFPIWWYPCSKSERSPLQKARWRLSFFQLTLTIASFLGCCIKIKHLTCQFRDAEWGIRFFFLFLFFFCGSQSIKQTLSDSSVTISYQRAADSGLLIKTQTLEFSSWRCLPPFFSCQ